MIWENGLDRAIDRGVSYDEDNNCYEALGGTSKQLFIEDFGVFTQGNDVSLRAAPLI